MRERIYESALRLGLLVRAYVSRPDQRHHVRQELGEMLAEARGYSDDVARLSHGRPRPEVVTAGEEADRLVAMVNSLRKVIARLELLERRGSAEPPGARDREAKEAMKAEIGHLVSKITEEEQQILDLESELDAVRRLRARETGRADESRVLRRRLAVAEGQRLKSVAQRNRLRKRLREAEALVRRLRRRPRRARRTKDARRRRRAAAGRSRRRPGSRSKKR